MFSNVNKLWIIVNFEINQAAIAKEKCENLDKPEMMCNGKCYLAKQMKEQEEKEQNETCPLEKEKVELIYYFDSSFINSSSLAEFELQNRHHFHIEEFRSQKHLQSIFRPPISA